MGAESAGVAHSGMKGAYETVGVSMVYDVMVASGLDAGEKCSECARALALGVCLPDESSDCMEEVAVVATECTSVGEADVRFLLFKVRVRRLASSRERR